jgi:hypothetical protein
MTRRRLPSEKVKGAAVQIEWIGEKEMTKERTCGRIALFIF